MHMVKEMNGIEMEKRVKYFSNDILTETWGKYYSQIYHYFFDNYHHHGSIVAFDIDNQKYIDTLNTFLAMKTLQVKINNNDAIEYWFKEYTNDVVSYLDIAFNHIYKSFNPYDSHNYFDDCATGTEVFFEVAECLEKIRLKYFKLPIAY